jgi:hypothetical protein
MNGPSKNKIIGQSSAVYGMGFVGALIYFIQQSTTFWLGCLGFVKALFWPGFLVYEILAYLKM